MNVQVMEIKQGLTKCGDASGSSWFDTYEVGKHENISMAKLLEFHFKEVLCSMQRKLSTKKKLRDRFVILTKERMMKEVFRAAYRMVRDHRVRHGVKASTETKQDGALKSYSLVFTDVVSLRYHVKKLAGVELHSRSDDIQTDNFTRELKGGNRAEVCCTADKPGG